MEQWIRQWGYFAPGIVFLAVAFVYAVFLIRMVLDQRNSPTSQVAHRKKAPGLPDYLNYLAVVDEGVILNKDMGFLTAFVYTGHDVTTDGLAESESTSHVVNRALRELGEGWVVQAETLRAEDQKYPLSVDSAPVVARFVDKIRRKAIQERQLLRTEYYLFLYYQPPPDPVEKTRRLLIEEGTENQEGVTSGAESELLAEYTKKIETVIRDLATTIAPRKLTTKELLAVLHRCIGGVDQCIHGGFGGTNLDILLGGHDVEFGLKPRVDGEEVRIVQLTGFPDRPLQPQELRFLSEFGFPCRTSYRFIFRDANSVLEEIKRRATFWDARRKGVLQQIAGTQGGWLDPHAAAMHASCETGYGIQSSGDARYGYVSVSVIVRSEMPGRVDAWANQVIEALRERGYLCRLELINAVPAWFGTLPVHPHANVRNLAIHSGNFADMFPVAQVWPGHATNPSPQFNQNNASLMVVRRGTTPVHFNLHVGDVGHTMLVGVTGSGKTTLMNMLAAQWLARYENSRVFVVDKKRGSYIANQLLGGTFLALGTSADAVGMNPVGQSYCTREGKAWLAEWIEEILLLAGQTVATQQRLAIVEAIDSLRSFEQPGMRELISALQDRQMKTDLFFYGPEGPWGPIFNPGSGRGLAKLEEAPIVSFEMENLLQTGSASRDRLVLPALRCLFRTIEDSIVNQKGNPTLILLDEAWLMLGHAVFRDKIAEWLRVMRSRNAAVVFATQNLADIVDNPLCAVLLEQCRSRIFLPNADACSVVSARAYRKMGLDDADLQLLRSAKPKREYYYVSEDARYIFDLNLCSAGFRLAAANGEADIAYWHRLVNQYGVQEARRQWFVAQS